VVQSRPASRRVDWLRCLRPGTVRGGHKRLNNQEIVHPLAVCRAFGARRAEARKFGSCGKVWVVWEEARAKHGVHSIPTRFAKKNTWNTTHMHTTRRRPQARCACEPPHPHRVIIFTVNSRTLSSGLPARGRDKCPRGHCPRDRRRTAAGPAPPAPPPGRTAPFLHLRGDERNWGKGVSCGCRAGKPCTSLGRASYRRRDVLN
jgi:hypothetical protein